jgi:hypothetical protein
MAKSKKASNVPANESAEQRFVRVATVKTNSILKGLKSLSRLTGTKAVSTAAQRTAIQTAIQTALDDAMKSLSGQKVSVGGFKL